MGIDLVAPTNRSSGAGDYVGKSVGNAFGGGRIELDRWLY